ncbi:M20/M25/M40 family metallo-hydrolase [Nocardia brasiliensis]|uniref:M20/M25/M40 family metallo-hydrolase n=1 Tax=Nocardia brasiliensis TaxID=37326 RepID=UPI00245767E1|nr:M20/M25/M40 family metallo-hydrolase [Nocardia brasiliensis]
MPSSTTTFVDQLSRLLPEAELVRLAAGLTAIASVTGQETPLAVHVRNTLLRNDIHAYHQEVEPGRLQTIARLGPETGTPALLLNGHLDMDPLGHDQPRTPFAGRRDGDRLYGAGLHNMKSGLAAILGAAIMVRRSGIALRRPLLLEFVVGELQDGAGTRHALRSGLTADAAVVPEPCSVRRVITRTAGVHEFAVVRDIAELLPQVSDFRVEDRGLALPHSYCGNETTHLSRAGIECCLFGPRGAGPDTEHHVLISEMRACADTLALLAARRCG